MFLQDITTKSFKKSDNLTTIMRLTRTIPIEADELSAELMANLVIGESITVHCNNTREYDNSRNNVHWDRKNKLRSDGCTYEF